MLTAIALISVLPASAQTVTYSVLGSTASSHTAAPLIQAADGKLYGTAQDQNADAGVVFSASLDGAFNFQVNVFREGASMGLADSLVPQEVLQSRAGEFFGVAGARDGAGGAIYGLSASGAYTPLHAFCAVAGCADGADPQGSLVENRDGNFYGLTAQGGAFGHGTVFRMTPGGLLTTIYSFTGGADGGAPTGALLVASDGNFYGATESGGSAGFGTVFRISAEGEFTSLHSFTDSEGDSNPRSGLIQASDGHLYGTTSGLPHDAAGTVYRLAMSPALAAPVQLGFSSATARVGVGTTLRWKVLNAFSATMQTCQAYLVGKQTGAGAWSGRQGGSYNSTSGLFTGSARITPTAAGTYSYALTCGGQESGVATLAVTNAGSATATVVLNATPNPVAVGQPISISATASGSGATPTGTVSFIYNSHTLTTLSLASGVASFSPSTAGIPAGNYALTASYSGDSNYAAAVSAPVTVTLSQATPTVTLGATPNPATVGQTVTITATTSGSSRVPTGTVAFKYGALTLASVPLAGGVASFTPSTNGVPSGTYNLVASYSGDANYLAATSPSFGLTLDKVGTAATLTASPQTVVQGSPCTLKATVTRSGAAGIPTGTVRFSVGTKALATVPVNSAGVASFTASTAGVAVGYYPVVATYSGDGSDNVSVSNTVSVYVRPSGYY